VGESASVFPLDDAKALSFGEKCCSESQCLYELNPEDRAVLFDYAPILLSISKRSLHRTVLENIKRPHKTRLLPSALFL